MSYSRPVPVHELRNFASDALALDDEAFRERHGAAFLLRERDLSALPKLGSDTVEMTPARTQSGGAAPTFVVYPLGSLAGNRVVRVGSGPKNQVTIEHPSVAPFHAVFTGEAGSNVALWAVHKDHETRIDEVIAPVHGGSEPKLVPSGVSVQFGDVRLTLLRAAEFRALVKALLA